MDKQVATYVVLNWIAVFCYVIATVANVSGVLFKKEGVERKSYWPVLAGLTRRLNSNG